MRYISTRGQAPALDFESVAVQGLAEDGGLYVPESLPSISPAEIADLSGLSYQEVCFRVMRLFTGGTMPDEDLKKLLDQAYQAFRHPAIAPLKQLDTNFWLLELFHGPTLAFKDVALQFLGHLLDYILERRGIQAVILGATSGDTGSAAIHGCIRCKNVSIVILHPKDRVSEVQRRQMTSATAPDVHNLAVEGTFDDCQSIVKTLFNLEDRSFLKGRKLVAVNSINWVRIMAQIPYYFYSAAALGAPAKPLIFSVPTGNFGDIFAGYLARQMGLPIEKLIIATNDNDIMARFIAGNRYEKKQSHETLSPSMDIQVASNFERLLFDLSGRNGEEINQRMNDFQRQGSLTLPAHQYNQALGLFDAYAANDQTTLTAIRETYEKTGEIVDPHTAIGVVAARKKAYDRSIPIIALATAHPAKFPDAIEQAIGIRPSLPPHLADLMSQPERYQTLQNDLSAVKDYIATH